MRNVALAQGYSLNEYSLTEKKTSKKIYVKTEKDIFKFLKMDYVEPKDRDIH